MRTMRSGLGGFTLIELLISLTIMMMIFTLGFYGYRLYNQSWQRDLSTFNQSFEQYKSIDLLNSALHGVIPYMVRFEDKQSFYFLGREQGFTAVTMTAIFNPQAPAVIRLFKEPTQNGQYQLVYEEASLQNIVLVDPDQILPFQHRLVIMSELQSIDFSYWSWKSKQALFDSVSETQADEAAPQWYSEFDALTAQIHPGRVLIKLENFELLIAVPQRSQLGEVIPEVVF